MSQGGGSGNILRKYLSWSGDSLTTEQTCFTGLGQTAEHRQTYGLDKLHRITSVTGANMPVMTHGLGDVPWSGGHSRTYSYTARGERDDSTIDGCGRTLAEGRASMLTSSLPASSCSSTVLEGPTFLYDESGRTREVNSGPSGPTQFREQLGYAASGGGLEAVFNEVALKRFETALYWEYYYDAFNRRRAKVPPTGTSEMEEFFYGLGHDELESLAWNGSWLTQIDDNIWLAGRLVAVFRGNLYTESHHRADSITSECARPGGAARCGLHFVINDATPKPILVMAKADGAITGAVLYDEFGHINRIPFIVGASQSKSLGRVSLPGGKIQARAFWRRASAGSALFEDIEQGGELAAQWGPWTSTDGSTAFASSSGYYDTQAEAVEYRRYSSKALPWFPNLRFPGQHWDEETDLFENWNRFYDPGSGRYLSPEPLLQSPAYVRRMAQTGMSVPTYAYAANNPLRYIDRTGLRLELMNQAAFDIAGEMAKNPQALASLEWLDSSPDTYQMWGDQVLDPGTGAQWFPGELAGQLQTSQRGGTLRVDNQACRAGGKNPAGAAAHETTHAGLRDAQTNPWSPPWRPPMPFPVQTFGPDAFPGGGLPGSHGDQTTPHGLLEFYWNAVFGGAGP